MGGRGGVESNIVIYLTAKVLYDLLVWVGIGQTWVYVLDCADWTSCAAGPPGVLSKC